MRRCLAAAPVAALVLGLGAAPAPAAGPRDGVLVSARSAAVLPSGARFVARLEPGLRAYTLPVPGGMTAAGYARALQGRPGVLGAQVNARMHRAALAGSCADAPSANNALALATSVNAVNVTAPGATAPVAVLDTGVDPTTPELRGRVLAGQNEATGTTDTTDLDGHGTEVASVVAAAPGRFQGISPTTPILPIGIYTISSDTTAAWVVKGIQDAVKAGAIAINISSSNPAKDVSSADARVLQQAITAAFDKGVITVVSGGNEGKVNPDVPGNMEHVIAVGSATPDGTRDSFSNFGPWIDLVSPGASLILPAPSVVCSSGYGVASGTSFSAPAVAGAVALIKALRPTLTATQLYDVIRMGSETDLYGAGRDDDSGFGLLNVATGSSGAVPANQPTEVDDDVFWLKQNPKKHPTLLRTARSYRTKSSVQAGKDPQDVFPIAMKAGQTLTATSTSSGSDALLSMGIWSPKTGSFDIGNGTSTYEVSDSGGVTNNPQVVYRARRSGTYYVSVEAPDLPDPSDPTTADTVVQPQTKYSLTLRETKAKKKAKKKKKKK